MDNKLIQIHDLNLARIKISKAKFDRLREKDVAAGDCDDEPLFADMDFLNN